MNSYYILNKETQKIELHFDKSDYLSLEEKQKSEIKSNFLFSRGAGAWVSRCKFPNLWRAEEIAKKLNLENAGKTGDRLTFAEQKAKEAEKAERRAEYYDYKSGVAIAEGERLQKPINDMHGDIAFFTQPNINTSAGRAFTNKRNRMFAAWEAGFEAFKKSEYYAERAKVARQTAKNADGKITKDFAQRRVDDANKTIRAQKRNIESYEKDLNRINSGEVLKRYNGEILTAETVLQWIENAGEIIENNIEKVIYYNDIIESLGGVNYSKENIKAGYIVKLSRAYLGDVKVISTGTKNFTYDSGNGFCLTASYAEIVSIVKSEEVKALAHPFKAGEILTGDVYNGNAGKYEKQSIKVVKATEKSVTLEFENGKRILRRPSFQTFSKTWFLSYGDGMREYISRAALV